jgi:predicted 3-demethylubiquinone-9 3-methyltransferase (glyoxalase superfamily)
MFEGAAEEAMNLYVSLFPASKVVSIERYVKGEASKEGSVKRAVFELSGTRYQCIDSPIRHEFTFTPAMSIFVDFDDRASVERAYETLSADGQVLMPGGTYGFSQWFAWIQDRYGVSWQLNLP